MQQALVVLAFLAAAGPPAERTVRERVEARVAEIAGGILPPMASARVAPPVPARWPPQGPTALVFHVYAAVFDPGLRDAERVLTSWALATLEPGAVEASLRTLRKPSRELGVQGVRPLRPEERQALATRDAAEGALAQMASEGRAEGAEAAEVRRYYCAWLSANGVFAGELRGASPEFFDWLGCQ
jgi:hypothetical protein